MSIVYVGIDLAKNVVAVHGVDEAGKPALMRPAVPRAPCSMAARSLNAVDGRRRVRMNRWRDSSRSAIA